MPLSINYVEIDAQRLDTVCDAYFKWKDLNTYIKQNSTRGINMPDVISEPIACYCLGYVWNRGNIVGDATNLKTNEKIEFKLPEIANTHLYKQAGNSVVVPVIERIANSISIALK